MTHTDSHVHVPASKRARHDDTVQVEELPYTVKGAQALSEELPRSIPLAAIMEPQGSPSGEAELLQRQLDAVETLCRVYQVEHYAVLEEMRLLHHKLWIQDRNSLQQSLPARSPAPHGTTSEVEPSSGEPEVVATAQPIASTARTSIRSLLSSKLSAAGRNSCSQETWASGAANGTSDAVPGSSATAAAAVPAATPGTPGMQKQKSSHLQQDMSSSPAGVSLNIWAAPAGSNNTPQSLRYPVSAPEAAGRSTSGHGPAQEQQQQGEGQAMRIAEAAAADDSHAAPASQAPLNLLASGGRQYGDELLGYGSDDEAASYSDAENLVLVDGARVASDDVGDATAVAWRTRFAAHAGQVAALEELACAASQQELDAEGALASLCCSAGQFVIRRTTVLIGRGSDTKGAVDVDLAVLAAGGASLEDASPDPEVSAAPTGDAAAAAKVSRRQAFLTLRPDGTWWLENVGRRRLHVDGSWLAQFEGAMLRHLALLEIGGLQLLFCVNHPAVERVLRRTARLVV